MSKHICGDAPTLGYYVFSWVMWLRYLGSPTAQRLSLLGVKRPSWRAFRESALIAWYEAMSEECPTCSLEN